MDASGRASGDRGYDQYTEEGYQQEPSYYDSSPMFGKIGKAMPSESELWLEDHPAQEMAPIDFSSAPSWWNKGESAGKIGSGAGWSGGNPMGKQPGFGKVGAGNSPTDSVMPDYGNIVDQQPASPGRMIDYIGNVGGQTGVVATSPLAAGLRGAAAAAADTGGQSNG